MEFEVVMSGRVNQNIGLIRALEAKLGKPVLMPGDPRIKGALGAALVARQGLS
jgi:activator of 2-hydroxyglutaryl-CoA dehydratase